MMCSASRPAVPQTPAERVYVRHLQRLPLGLSYPVQVQAVNDLMARPPLNGDGKTPSPKLIIDRTGVGRAVGDIFSEAGLRHEAVTITAGEAVSYSQGSHHVAKTQLISVVDAMLHTGTLRLAAALSEAGAMRDELKDFRRKLSDAGRATYAARTGSQWSVPENDPGRGTARPSADRRSRENASSSRCVIGTDA
jgi:hypothetical protein